MRKFSSLLVLFLSACFSLLAGNVPIFSGLVVQKNDKVHEYNQGQWAPEMKTDLGRWSGQHETDAKWYVPPEQDRAYNKETYDEERRQKALLREQYRQAQRVTRYGSYGGGYGGYGSSYGASGSGYGGGYGNYCGQYPQQGIYGSFHNIGGYGSLGIYRPSYGYGYSSHGYQQPIVIDTYKSVGGSFGAGIGWRGGAYHTYQRNLRRHRH